MSSRLVCPLFSDSGGRVDKTAEHRGEIDSLGAVDAQQNIIQKSQAGDHYNSDPFLTWLEQLPRVDEPVWQERPDYKAQEREQQRAPHFLLAEPSCERPELGLQGKQHRNQN